MTEREYFYPQNMYFLKLSRIYELFIRNKKIPRPATKKLTEFEGRRLLGGYPGLMMQRTVYISCNEPTPLLLKNQYRFFLPGWKCNCIATLESKKNVTPQIDHIMKTKVKLSYIMLRYDFLFKILRILIFNPGLIPIH